MSYILEALKKAQAERQLGNAPTIHTPAPAYTVAASRGSRNPLVAGAIAGTLVVALGAVFLLRQPAPAPAQVANVPAQALAPDAVPATAPVAVAAAPAAAPPAPPEPAKPAERAKPAPPPNPPAPARVAAKAPAPVAQAEAAPQPEPAEAVPETPRPALVAAAPAAPVTAAPAVAALAAEDSIGPLQSLPEAVQREVPRLSFGGYIYSPNPAERLLLVDKMLRREGEEVAPGLVLERLLPKAAIMNFRGYRYRVAY